MRSEGTPNPYSLPGVAILKRALGHRGLCLTEKRVSSSDWAEPRAIITKENHLHSASQELKTLKNALASVPWSQVPKGTGFSLFRVLRD